MPPASFISHPFLVATTPMPVCDWDGSFAHPGAAVKACDKFLVGKGCPAEDRVSGHGQGLDLVERPVFLKDEVCKMEAGMIVCLHPTARTKNAAVCLSDTYVVTESGAVPLYKNLFDDNEIVEVG
jgi:Xaa-Pro aminopeptidase